MSGAAIAVDRKWRRSTAGKLIAIAPAFVRGASGRGPSTPDPPASDSIGRCGSSRSWSRSSRRCPSRPSRRRRRAAISRPTSAAAATRWRGTSARPTAQLADRLRRAAGHLGGVDLPGSVRRPRPSSARRSPRSAAASRRGRRAADRGRTWRCATVARAEADRPVVAARQGRARRLLPGRRRAALGRLAQRVLRADVVSRGRTMSVSKKTPRAAARSTRTRVTQPVAAPPRRASGSRPSRRSATPI